MRIAVVLGLAAFATGGCAAHSRKSALQPPAGVEERLETAYRSWQGTPHRLGGRGRDGIDCSGFVQTVFRDSFAIALPRTTAAQANSGRAIERNGLRAGDLVFFRPGSYPRHVGIYMREGRFLHVSAKKGVMISHLDGGYWARHYWTARRVF